MKLEYYLYKMGITKQAYDAVSSKKSLVQFLIGLRAAHLYQDHTLMQTEILFMS